MIENHTFQPIKNASRGVQCLFNKRESGAQNPEPLYMVCYGMVKKFTWAAAFVHNDTHSSTSGVNETFQFCLHENCLRKNEYTHLFQLCGLYILLAWAGSFAMYSLTLFSSQEPYSILQNFFFKERQISSNKLKITGLTVSKHNNFCGYFSFMFP